MIPGLSYFRAILDIDITVLIADRVWLEPVFKLNLSILNIWEEFFKSYIKPIRDIICDSNSSSTSKCL